MGQSKSSPRISRNCYLCNKKDFNYEFKIGSNGDILLESAFHHKIQMIKPPTKFYSFFNKSVYICENCIFKGLTSGSFIMHFDNIECIECGRIPLNYDEWNNSASVIKNKFVYLDGKSYEADGFNISELVGPHKWLCKDHFNSKTLEKLYLIDTIIPQELTRIIAEYLTPKLIDVRCFRCSVDLNLKSLLLCRSENESISREIYIQKSGMLYYTLAPNNELDTDGRKFICESCAIYYEGCKFLNEVFVHIRTSIAVDWKTR